MRELKSLFQATIIRYFSLFMRVPSHCRTHYFSRIWFDLKRFLVLPRSCASVPSYGPTRSFCSICWTALGYEASWSGTDCFLCNVCFNSSKVLETTLLWLFLHQREPEISWFWNPYRPLWNLHQMSYCHSALNFSSPDLVTRSCVLVGFFSPR